MSFIPSIKIESFHMVNLWGAGMNLYVVYTEAQELSGIQLSISLFNKQTDIGLLWI